MSAEHWWMVFFAALAAVFVVALRLRARRFERERWRPPMDPANDDED
ncbi:hypothetical protein AncyloWKF20_05045 [Ancylobacter sp. WKF20]|nr:hypothetical protein [Ancylobacter sp. WKF20]WGD31190.1 hypothetical protein AncyloWKF20_05045 [Ancylobacter sp. WKF20]